MKLLFIVVIEQLFVLCAVHCAVHTIKHYTYIHTYTMILKHLIILLWVSIFNQMFDFDNVSQEPESNLHHAENTDTSKQSQNTT